MDIAEALRELLDTGNNTIEEQARVIADDPSFSEGVKRQLARMFAGGISAEDGAHSMQRAINRVLVELVEESQEDQDAWKKYLPTKEGDTN